MALRRIGDGRSIGGPSRRRCVAQAGSSGRFAAGGALCATYNILLMGASYGSLLASKLLFGGH